MKFLRIILWPLLFVVGILYAFVVLTRNFLYDLELMPSFKIEGAKVISIGNVTAGGTGKTPITALLLGELLDREFKVGVVSRGYGGTYSSQASNSVALVDFNLARAANIFGDEPTWIAQNFVESQVWVGADRVAAARSLMSAKKCDIILADDSFQHRRLKRDLDILVIDASAPLSDYLPIPLGRGREDFYLAVKRVGLIIINKTNFSSPSHLKMVRSILKFCKNKSAQIVECSSRIEHFSFSKSGEVVSNENISKQKVFLVTGIARPEQFSELVAKNTSAKIVGHLKLKDHDRFSSETRQKIDDLAFKQGANYILVTEKDAVKLKAADFKLPVLVSRLQLSAPELMDAVLSRISR